MHVGGGRDVQTQISLAQIKERKPSMLTAAEPSRTAANIEQCCVLLHISLLMRELMMPGSGGWWSSVQSALRYQSPADLTCCCKVYYDEKEGEAEDAVRVGRVGCRHTFHEVGDVHVGN